MVEYTGVWVDPSDGPKPSWVTVLNLAVFPEEYKDSHELAGQPGWVEPNETVLLDGLTSGGAIVIVTNGIYHWAEFCYVSSGIMPPSRTKLGEVFSTDRSLPVTIISSQPDRLHSRFPQEDTIDAIIKKQLRNNGIPNPVMSRIRPPYDDGTSVAIQHVRDNLVISLWKTQVY